MILVYWVARYPKLFLALIVLVLLAAMVAGLVGGDAGLDKLQSGGFNPMR